MSFPGLNFRPNRMNGIGGNPFDDIAEGSAPFTKEFSMSTADLATPHDFRFDIGSTLKCKITGFEGVLVARTQWIANCNTYTLRPKTLNKDGEIQDTKGFDEPMLDLEKENPFDLPDQEEFEFELGAVLRDNITGFEGVVTGRSQWVAGGNNTYCLKPQKLKDGMPQKTEWFDEAMLSLKASTFYSPYATYERI